MLVYNLRELFLAGALRNQGGRVGASRLLFIVVVFLEIEGDFFGFGRD